MSIVSVELVPGSRTSGMDGLFRRTYGVTLRVTTDDPAEHFLAVRSATDPGTGLSVPWIGTPFALFGEVDGGSFCNSVEVSEADDGTGLVWDVKVEYGVVDWQAFGPNPVEWPLKVSVSTVERELPVDFDRDGDPIRNSARQRFGDPVTVPYSDPVITCVRNEAVGDFSLTLAHDLTNTINGATWNGFAAGVVLCRSITTSEEQYDTNSETWYYKVTYVFETNRFGWRKKVLDQGYCELAGSPAKLKRILDSEGQPIDEPAPLDGAGGKLEPDDTPVVLEFDIYESADFSVFNLDFAVRLGVA